MQKRTRKAHKGLRKRQWHVCPTCNERYLNRCRIRNIPCCPICGHPIGAFELEMAKHIQRQNLNAHSGYSGAPGRTITGENAPNPALIPVWKDKNVA